MCILVAEQDSATLLVSELRDRGHRVETVTNGLDAFSKAMASCYELFLTELDLPEMDGLTLVQKLRERGLSMPILVLSGRRDVASRVRALELGADDFLVKPFVLAEFHARVKALIRRNRGTETRLEFADLSLDLLGRRVKRGGVALSLQHRELELLAFLMANAGQVVSKAEIFKNVWRYHVNPSTNVIESRISRLREKVDRPFGKKLIHTIRGAGYVLRESY